MKRFFLSAGVVALLAANTYGLNDVWWTATPSGGSASVTQQGAPGVPLILNQTTGGSWLITANYAEGGGATGWALDYTTATAGISASGETIPANALNAITNAGAAGNSPGAFLTGSGGFTLAPGGAPAATYTLHTFTLSAASGTLLANIMAGIGGIEFGGDDTANGYENVRLGSNLPMEGATGSSGTDYQPVPVIVVTPEPATLSMLALGVVAIIRRRK